MVVGEPAIVVAVVLSPRVLTVKPLAVMQALAASSWAGVSCVSVAVGVVVVVWAFAAANVPKTAAPTMPVASVMRPMRPARIRVPRVGKDSLCMWVYSVGIVGCSCRWAPLRVVNRCRPSHHGTRR